MGWRFFGGVKEIPPHPPPSHSTSSSVITVCDITLPMTVDSFLRSLIFCILFVQPSKYSIFCILSVQLSKYSM